MSGTGTGPTDFSRLVQDAKKVREYGLEFGILPDDALVNALAPFDAAGTSPDAEDYAELQRAARSTYARLDRATLRDILDEDGPSKAAGRRRKRRLFGSETVVVLLAVLLFTLAFHYTNWSKRAHILIANVEALAAKDYFGDFVEVGRSVQSVRLDAAGGAQTLPDLENAEVLGLIEKINDFEAFEFRAQGILTQFPELNTTFHPRHAIASLVSGFVPVDAGTVSGLGNWISELFGGTQPAADPPPTTSTAAAQPTTSPVAGPADICAMEPDELLALKRAPEGAVGPVLPASLTESRDAFLHAAYFYDCIVSDFVERVNGPLTYGANTYTAALAALDNQSNQLVNKVEITDRWSLPAIYGALGATIYVLVRFMSTYMPNPGFREAFLRMVFGGFIGITVSILFYPNNVAGLTGGTAPSFLLLSCFVLGYSIDTFITLLERIDGAFRSTGRSDSG